MKYIMTSRLTQDVLESLFSQVRGLGRFNDHPSPNEVIYRMRQLLLSNKLPSPSEKSNTLQDTEISAYLTAELIDSAFEENVVEEISANVYGNDTTLSQNCNINIHVNNNNLNEINTAEGKCWAEEEAINYVAGYIAHKVKDKDPNLGEITKNITYENETWIATLSYGGLTEPTKEWKAIVRNFEEEFVQMHGHSLDRGKYVISRLKNQLGKKYSDVYPGAIALYSRLRTFIRIRHLNRQNINTRKEKQKMSKWLKSGKM